MSKDSEDDSPKYASYSKFSCVNMPPPFSGDICLRIEGPTKIPPITLDERKMTLRIIDNLWKDLRREIVKDFEIYND